MEKITYTNASGFSVTFGRIAPFYLESINANSLGTSVTTFKAIGQDGQHTHDISYNARTIMCTLSLVGLKDGQYDLKTMRENWKKVCRVIVPKEKGTLVYKNDGGTYKIDCYPLELPNFDKVVGTKCRFVVQFIADKPFWKSEFEFTNRLGQVIGGKRYPVKYDPTMKYGTWVKDLRVNNDTGVDLPFVAEISSVSDYVRLVSSSGEFIEVNQRIEEGEKLVIDTENYTVTLVGVDGTETPANYKLSLDSTYFRLKKGESVIVLENGEESMSNAVLRYNKLYLGV